MKRISIIFFITVGLFTLYAQESYYKFIYNQQYKQIKITGTIEGQGVNVENQYNNYNWIEIKTDNKTIYALCPTLLYNLSLKDKGKRCQFILLEYPKAYYLCDYYIIGG